MRIEFLIQDDPLYVFPFFDELIRHYSSEFKIARISSCRVMGNRSRVGLLRALFCLYGLPGFVRWAGRQARARLMATLPRGRGAKRFYSTAQVSRAYDIPYHVMGNPNSAEEVRGIAERAPDLIVSVACPYILKEQVLKVPPLGCINIHHAPLPRYRGMMPTFWQMYYGESKLGLTIHYMTLRLDVGDALLQSSLEIEPGEPLEHLIERSKRQGAHAMAQVLRGLASGSQRTVALDSSPGGCFTFPTVEQIREFRRRGLRAV